MKNTMFLIVGIILISAGALVYFTSGSVRITNTNGTSSMADSDTAELVRSAVAGGLGLLGLLFLILGLRGRSRAAKAAKLNSFIIQTGADANGTITFVDKNYYITINNKPIYSIVEYTFKDGSGKDHTRRVDTVPSDWVIRNRIEVGGALKVKYLREDPDMNVMLF